MISKSPADELIHIQWNTYLLELQKPNHSSDTAVLTFPVLVQIHILSSLGEVTSAQGSHLEHEPTPVSARLH
jgi:hypothetical protein